MMVYSIILALGGRKAEAGGLWPRTPKRHTQERRHFVQYMEINPYILLKNKMSSKEEKASEMGEVLMPSLMACSRLLGHTHPMPLLSYHWGV